MRLSIENFISNHEETIKTKFSNLKLDFFQDNDLWAFYGKYTLQGPELLSYSFRDNIKNLETRLDMITMNSLDSLNEEFYTLYTNKMKEIFFKAGSDGDFNTHLIDFERLSEREISDALEEFFVILTDSRFLGDFDADFLYNTYDSQTLQHTAFQQLLSMQFLAEDDLVNWGVIINNHIKAIDMINEGNIPLYNGDLIDVNDLDVLWNDTQNINYDNIPKSFPHGTSISEVYNDRMEDDNLGDL